ncbi:DUF2971 domain-containing protein [Aquipseudomonas alcaligenes]|uniref:DUF2971 domain-containing protein n=1 Tax=Aquipseudomonas alcaligenes TaxID=43263 RepID=UPI001F48F8E0|nr:DUF2971 domain-containing protein [Pseudomonas alcaligenes]
MSLININYVCPVPSTLELPRIVYKYREANELLLRSLLLNQVWLAKPESFNDPFEPERIFSGSNFSGALDRDIRESGILCLCKSNSNLPMWSYYGGGLRGVAIGYDLAGLLETLTPVSPSSSECSPRWKYIYDLSYNNEELGEINEIALLQNNHLTDLERQKMFATKSSAYSHEEECRIVVPPSPDSQQGFTWGGHGLYQHDSSAVREIVFGELTSPQDRQAIMQIMAGRDVRFFDATRTKHRFEITVSPQNESSGNH